MRSSYFSNIVSLYVMSFLCEYRLPKWNTPLNKRALSVGPILLPLCDWICFWSGSGGNCSGKSVASPKQKEKKKWLEVMTVKLKLTLFSSPKESLRINWMKTFLTSAAIVFNSRHCFCFHRRTPQLYLLPDRHVVNIHKCQGAQSLDIVSLFSERKTERDVDKAAVFVLCGPR